MHVAQARRELCTDATATGATSYVAQKGTEASGRGVSYRMLQLAAGVCDGSIAGVRPCRNDIDIENDDLPWLQRCQHLLQSLVTEFMMYCQHQRVVASELHV